MEGEREGGRRHLSLFHQHFSHVFKGLDRQANRTLIPVSLASPINRRRSPSF